MDSHSRGGRRRRATDDADRAQDRRARHRYDEHGGEGGARARGWRGGDRDLYEGSFSGGRTANYGWRGCERGLRFRWQDNLPEEPRLAAPPRIYGALRRLERSRAEHRPDDFESEGIALSHAADARELRGDSRGAVAPRHRCVRM